jgi:hypothetical protein
MTRVTFVLSLALALAAGPLGAGEGKWTPQQILELGPEWLHEQGFDVPLERLWDADEGGGLLANAIDIPGCSASFVSPEGLLITNHHCIVDILVEHATPEANLLRDGYLARSRADELRASAYPIRVPAAFHDVTAEVREAVPEGASDLERFRAVEAKGKALVAACEEQPSRHCTFATFDDGVMFTLTEFRELKDARLVYAPPEAVGSYGGEVDNWMWPRHSGDFALLRVYGDDGQPWRPEHWFPVSTEGVGEGDAVAVLGYPGRTYRSWIVDEMAERAERYFPTRQRLYEEWIGILQEEGTRSPVAQIAVADDLRSLENRKKNAAGQIAGLRRGRIVEKQREAEERVKAWAAGRPGGHRALEAYEGLVRLNEERLATWERDFLLDEASRGAWGLRWALQIARRATEGLKPDAEREPGYQERDLELLRQKLLRDQKRYAGPADRRLFLSWTEHVLELPADQRLAPIAALFSGIDGAALEARVAEMYRNTRILDPDARLEMFEETPEELRARQDPLIDLGLALDAERLALKEQRDTRAGARLRLRPAWRRAVIGEAGRPVAPDGNRTLRVTVGRVRGYSPRDAVVLRPQTTLGGMVAKHTGTEPFDAPEPLRQAWAERRLGRWVDPDLGDIPVDYLSDCDTTGGNSGSPSIDGQGRLVGVNFDRVWENIANDFGYNPAIARNVSVDVRYLLWILDEIEGAEGLLRELGVEGDGAATTGGAP